MRHWQNWHIVINQWSRSHSFGNGTQTPLAHSIRYNRLQVTVTVKQSVQCHGVTEHAPCYGSGSGAQNRPTQDHNDHCLDTRTPEPHLILAISVAGEVFMCLPLRFSHLGLDSGQKMGWELAGFYVVNSTESPLSPVAGTFLNHSSLLQKFLWFTGAYIWPVPEWNIWYIDFHYFTQYGRGLHSLHQRLVIYI